MLRREITKKETRDMRTLLRFVEIYCRAHHDGQKAPFTFKHPGAGKLSTRDVMLCSECRKLLTYGFTMRLRCPHDPKPMCKKCESQCYRGDYRERIREVMKFSGLYLVKHGRVDLLYHYLR